MPTTPVAIGIFLLMVVPGIALELLRQRARPGRQDSVFVETSRVLLGGVLLSGTSLLVLGLLRTTTAAPLADPRELFTRNSYLPDNLWLVGTTAALFVTISITSAALFYSLFPYQGLQGEIAQESAWVTVFARLAGRVEAEKRELLRGKRLITQVQVDLDDGTGYIGTRESYSADVVPENRELVLTRPLRRVDADGTELPLDESWERVIVGNDKVRAIRVLFMTVDNKASAPAHRVLTNSRRDHAIAFARFCTTDPRCLTALLAAQTAIPALLGVFR
ncbi:DUF6338 family protein [Actinosynnema sp. NPDC047251]|uniref:Putative membrane protein n=1 Tax=Saccharothrix espanaensis (strain ATCC 51144 / DSM 44229 / JCM 9112 / NBRC 15066 / NRRL 15764) TaxID=1179773 RepID=K0JWK8_SACES|nr:DUF6338 family protein [Saccharothrix espanaensis]CCH29164.1 putative membrane protein [Saccharothrix espanaensis DSM 44229]